MWTSARKCVCLCLRATERLHTCIGSIATLMWARSDKLPSPEPTQRLAAKHFWMWCAHCADYAHQYILCSFASNVCGFSDRPTCESKLSKTKRHRDSRTASEHRWSKTYCWDFRGNIADYEGGCVCVFSKIAHRKFDDGIATHRTCHRRPDSGITPRHVTPEIT